MEVAGAAHPPPYVLDAPAESAGGGITDADVADWLSRQPREHLGELLVAQLRRDAHLRRRLQLAAAGDLDCTIDLDNYRAVVDAAASVDAYGGFVDWNDGFDWAEGVPNDYRDALGEVGLATYVEEVEARWQGLPALGPGDEPVFDTTRIRLEAMLRELWSRPTATSIGSSRCWPMTGPAVAATWS